MSCDEFENLLADYLGNELDRPDRERLDSHLESCASCRDEVNGLKATLVELQELKTVNVYRARRVTSQLEVRRKAAWPRRFLLGGLRYAAMLIVGVGIGLHFNISPRGNAAIDATVVPSIDQLAAGRDVHPDWIRAAMESSRRFRSQSSFVRNLAVLSQAGKGN